MLRFFPRPALPCLLLAFGCLHAATTIVAATDLGPVKSVDGGATWQVLPVNVSSGLLSGQPTFYALALDPKTPSTWYATGYAGGSYGFYKSTDSGQIWTATPFVTFQPEFSIAIDPVATNTIYTIGTTNTNVNNFVAKSTDSGATWTKLKLPNTTLYPAVSFPDGIQVASIRTDPQITGVVYAIGYTYIFESLDFGATWAALSTGVDTPEGQAVGSGFPGLARIDFDPRDRRVLYASSGFSSEANKCKGTPAGGECGLYKSVDSGLTWTQLGLQSPGTQSLSIDPVSGAIYAGAVLTGSSGAVFKSTDGGTTFTPLMNKFSLFGPYVHVDPNNPSTVYAFARLGLRYGSDNTHYYRSTDAGATWTAVTIPDLCPVTSPKCTSYTPPSLFDLLFLPPAASGTPGPPTVSTNGVVNGADFLPGISPNSWATVQGVNLAPTTDDWGKFIVNGEFPTTFDGVSVTIGGKLAYLYYITPTQLNILVPDVGLGPMQVTVTTAAGTSAQLTVTSSQYSPAFFLWPNNQAVATQQNYSLAAKSGTLPGLSTVPAKPGDILILWGTGFGPTNPVPPSGTAVPGDKTYSASVIPTVTINNVSATVYGAALASGFAGLYQVAIQVPPTLTDGDWPIVANVAGVPSPAGIILSVHH